MNQYQRTIKYLGELLLNYDYDKEVPVFGFGGIPRFDGSAGKKVDHCFSVNGNPKNPNIKGIDEILRSYLESVKKVDLSSPTLFEPILQEAKKIGLEYQAQGSKNYLVFIILTDGEIYDMPKVVDLIVEMATLPISVIIIGVGNAKFEKMNMLDGETALVDSKGRRQERDIVQFVQFRDF